MGARCYYVGMGWFRHHILDHFPAHLFFIVVGAIFIVFSGVTPEHFLAHGVEALPEVLRDSLSPDNGVLALRAGCVVVGLTIIAIAFLRKETVPAVAPAAPPAPVTSTTSAQDSRADYTSEDFQLIADLLAQVIAEGVTRRNKYTGQADLVSLLADYDDWLEFMRIKTVVAVTNAEFKSLVNMPAPVRPYGGNTQSQISAILAGFDARIRRLQDMQDKYQNLAHDRRT